MNSGPPKENTIEKILKKTAELENNNEYQEALRILDDYLLAEPENASLLLNKGRIYLKLDEPKKALDAVLGALSIQPDNADFLFQKAIVLLKLKKYSESASSAREALEKGDGSLTPDKTRHLMVIRSKALREQGDLKASEKELLAALDHTGEDAGVFAELGRLAELKGELDKATEYFYSSLRQDDSDPSVFSDLGRVFYRLNNYKKASEALETSLKIEDSNPANILLLASAYEKTDREEKAEELLKKIEVSDNKTSEYYKLISDIYKRRKDYSRADEALRRALEIDPSDADIYADLGKVLSYMGRDSEALELFSKASGIEPTRGDYQYEAGKIYLNRKEPSEALREFREAISKKYESPDIYLSVARCARALNRMKEAEGYYRKALELSPYREKLWFQNRIRNDIEICKRKEVLESAPRNLGVCLTNRCNLRCVMCEVVKESWDISRERAEEVESLFPYIEQVLWQGGEVFLSKYFRPLFEKAREYEHLSQAVLTNGLLINKEWARLFASSKTEVTFSMEALNKKAYESIRIGSDYDKVLKNLRLLSDEMMNTPDSKLKINIQFLVFENNIEELRDLINFAQKFGIKKIFLIPLDETINKKNTFYDDPGYRKELGLILNDLFIEAACKSVEIVNSLPVSGYTPPDSLEAWPEHREIKDNPDNTGTGSTEDNAELNDAISTAIPCLWPWQQLSVCSGGNAVINGLCPYLIIGNINKNSIREIWNGHKLRSVRRALIGKKEDNAFCTGICLEGGLNDSLMRLD